MIHSVLEDFCDDRQCDPSFDIDRQKTVIQRDLILGDFFDELFLHFILRSTFILGELFFDTFFNYQQKWKRVNCGENCISLSESDKREN